MSPLLPAAFTGEVVHGKQLGRTLGMPTANIFPSDIPAGLAHGVYLSSVTVCGETFRSITNLGSRPTVDDGDAVNLETFIYGFDRDIYGETITVILTRFLRPEMRFDSVDALAAQIRADIEAGRSR